MASDRLRTLVLGASPDPWRYAYKATMRLLEHGHEPIPLGIREGEIGGVPIRLDRPAFEDVHTVTVYLAPENQGEYYDYVLRMNPERIVFNPGAENPEFEARTRAAGVETLAACTLVMLSTGRF